MGFRLPERTVRIDFEGTPYDGAEVVIRLSVSVATYKHILEVARANDVDMTISALGDLIESWNLEDDDGNPIPPTTEGLEHVKDPLFIGALFDGWLAAMQGRTAVPLAPPEKSSDGSTSTSETQPPATPM